LPARFWLEGGMRGRLSNSVGAGATDRARPQSILSIRAWPTGVTATRLSDAAALTVVIGPGLPGSLPAAVGAQGGRTTGVGEASASTRLSESVARITRWGSAHGDRADRTTSGGPTILTFAECTVRRIRTPTPTRSLQRRRSPGSPGVLVRAAPPTPRRLVNRCRSRSPREIRRPRRAAHSQRCSRPPFVTLYCQSC
jgi:hypothetical protein